MLIDKIFSQEISISEKLKVATNYSPETYYTFKPQWEELKAGLNDAGEHLDEFPTSIREAVQKIAAIVVEAAGGISFADVCKSLAESQLATWSNVGWRAYKAATKPPAIWWTQKMPSSKEDGLKSSNERERPLSNTASNDQIQRSLARARERFSKAAECHRNLAVLLVHSAELCVPKPPDWPDLFEPAGKYRLNIQGGPRSEARQLFDKDGKPLVATQPIVTPNGEQILFSNGKPVAMYLGAERTYSLIGSQFPGSSEFGYSGAVDEYMDASSVAGLIIDDLPDGIKAIIWRDWPFGYIKPDSAALWTNAVFELAWQNHPGTGLATDRWTWLANKKLKIDDVPGMKNSPLASFFGDLLERAGDPPRYWYSWLPNIWRASATAIDIIDSLVRESLADDRRSDFEPGSRRNEPSRTGSVLSDDVIHTVDELEAKTPKLNKRDPNEWLRFDQLKSVGETPSTKSLREQRSAGKKTNDNSFGVCKAGRIWRKDGGRVWYFVPSLLPVREKAQPLISAALRLISTVD